MKNFWRGFFFVPLMVLTGAMCVLAASLPIWIGLIIEGDRMRWGWSVVELFWVLIGSGIISVIESKSSSTR